MKLIMLGTGNAMVTKCYNTCFALADGEQTFLTDAGGGNGILQQIDKAGISYTSIHDMFITHTHSDHILGAVWLIRKIASLMKQNGYEGFFRIYGHADAVSALRTMCELTLAKKFTDFIGERILLHPVLDGDTITVMNRQLTCFDIHSTKLLQYGYAIHGENGYFLTCLGDEPYTETSRSYVAHTEWLLCEAFCRYQDRERFKPYEKHHSTVKDAAELAEQLSVKNMILYHTEDTALNSRKADYTAEAKAYYTGNVYVPDDLDCIDIMP